jgi:DNA polymerase-3 subunit epsilon
MEVHGITNEFLADKPLFADIGTGLMDYLRGAELIIHNAAFDVGFLDAELERIDPQAAKIAEVCGVHDTLLQARKMFPGQRNDLDSLCRRFDINNSHRELHGALLDAEILADVYLFMTGGQSSLLLEENSGSDSQSSDSAPKVNYATLDLPLVQASTQEKQSHVEWLNRLDEKADGQCVWSRLNSDLTP